MKKSIITKFIIQAVAVVFGLYGLFSIYFGFCLAIVGIEESEHIFGIIMSVIFILFGGIIFGVAWQNLRHFGQKSIQNITGLVVFLVYTSLMPLMEPLEPKSNLTLRLLFPAIFLILMLLAYKLYRFLSRKLIQLTEIESSQQAEPADPSIAASDMSSETR